MTSEIRSMCMLGILVLLITILLGFMFVFERRTMLLGGVFLSWAILVIIFLIITLETYETHIALIVAVITLAPVVVLFPFYFASFIVLLLSSGLRLIKREGKKLRNFLSLTLGIFCMTWVIISLYMPIPEGAHPVWMGIYRVVTFGVYYFFVALLIFVVSSLLNRIPIPFKTYDYIIVLGSGLIGEKVSPLLAARIDKGIQLFHRFHTATHPVKVIFTGGQGNDETLAEGDAMANYAMEKGMKKKDIIIEDKAVNTYENLLFSKQLIEENVLNKGSTATYNIITVTNNFHVFRALLWARKVRLKSDGAGAKTKFYFWLNALIREFIGVLYMQKKYHLSLILLGVVFIILITSLDYFLLSM